MVVTWTLDDRITVRNQLTAQIIIDVPLREINRASVTLTQLILVVNAQKYRFDLAGRGGVIGPLGGLFTLWNWYNSVKRSRIIVWSKTLQKAGVPMGQTDPVRPFKLGFIIGLSLMGAIFLLAIVAISIREFS